MRNSFRIFSIQRIGRSESATAAQCPHCHRERRIVLSAGKYFVTFLRMPLLPISKKLRWHSCSFCEHEFSQAALEGFAISKAGKQIQSLQTIGECISELALVLAKQGGQAERHVIQVLADWSADQGWENPGPFGVESGVALRDGFWDSRLVEISRLSDQLDDQQRIDLFQQVTVLFGMLNEDAREACPSFAGGMGAKNLGWNKVLQQLGRALGLSDRQTELLMG